MIDRVGLDDRVYVDANILIYWLERVEPFCRRTDRLLDRVALRGATLATSEVSIGECLRHPFRHDNADLITLYETLFAGDEIETIPVDRPVLFRAAEISGTTGLKLFDAIHVASAAAARCAVLVTNDRRIRTMPTGPVVQLTDPVFDPDPPQSFLS